MNDVSAMCKLDARRLPPSAQEDLRRRVVAAVRGGMRKAEAARVFGVAPQSVRNWTGAADERGMRGLRSRKRGPKRGSGLLAPHQAASMVRMITASCPDQLRLPFALWTREAVCELAQRRFGVSMSVWTAGRYLRRWGLTPQKPVRRAYERDPAAVRHWLDVKYPAIKAGPRRSGRRSTGGTRWACAPIIRAARAIRAGASRPWCRAPVGDSPAT